MNQRMSATLVAILALVGFEAYAIRQAVIYSDSPRKCFPTGESFPYKDSNGTIKYESIYHTISDFNLTDQNGNTFNNSMLKDKVYIANFFFTTCPTICPKMTKNMSLLHAKFRNNQHVSLLSHTIDPEHDTPKVLKEFASRNMIDDRQWHLLTGSRKQIYELSKQSYYLGVERDSPDSFFHSEKLVLVDNHRVIRGFYDGTSSEEVERLGIDVEKLILELKREQSVSPSEGKFQL